ncbi:ER lumen protein-retaining receptor [Aspergillus tanneri]|uniref:Endoplasmic reticulum retention protein n=1 Tax=Aspergillus tanneri TaxID=1220188 RepID=A0A5M9MSI5_9EURO|nr:endoplasmic reticulum retention protein [Aspergillus tanneri]KAA8647539.1 endoplasmic reticulum retention protein [Aspergillus tanneri]
MNVFRLLELLRTVIQIPYAIIGGVLSLIHSDLFWAFADSLYNTTFKILFIGSSAYIIYLMLNDYKPTHDPNLDTFKVQYLLGFSAFLAIAFPHDYRVSEVSPVSLVDVEEV